MNNPTNESLAAHVADQMDSGRLTTVTEIERELRVGRVRAYEIKERAEEKRVARLLAMWPRPNHENTTKEWNR